MSLSLLFIFLKASLNKGLPQMENQKILTLFLIKSNWSTFCKSNVVKKVVLLILQGVIDLDILFVFKYISANSDSVL